MTWLTLSLALVIVAVLGAALAVYGCCVMAGRADDRLNRQDRWPVDRQN